MSTAGAAPRAAVTVSSARAEASRKNGAKSHGPKTPEGKARSARNALRHGLRAEKRAVLPEEDADEFAALEAALIEELAPVGALQALLARPVRGASLRGRRARARPDPRRQRDAVVRDAAALPRRGDGGVLARAAHPQGAPGRAGGRGRCRLGRVPGEAGGAATARPPAASERTRAPRPAPARVRGERATRARSHAARARRAVAAGRTRTGTRGPAGTCAGRTRAPRPSERTRPVRLAQPDISGRGPATLTWCGRSRAPGPCGRLDHRHNLRPRA